MAKKRFAVFATGYSAQNLDEYLQGMQQYLADFDVDLYLFLSYSVSLQDEKISKAQFNIFNLPVLTDFDGIAVVSSSIDNRDVLNNLLEEAVKSGVPTVSRGYEYDGTCNISVTDDGGMYNLCEHLIKIHGIKRPAFIAGPQNSDASNLRYKIFRRVLEVNGIDFNESFLCYSQWSNFIAQGFIRELKKTGNAMPDAFICANDGLAMATCIQLEALGYSVPSDIVVTGFDFIHDSQCFYPSIASVDQRFGEMGYESAKYLYERSENRIEPKKSKILPCRFVPGESCGCANFRNDNKIRGLACRKTFELRMDAYSIRRIISEFDNAITTSAEIASIREKLRNVQYGVFMNGYFHFIINPVFFERGLNYYSLTAYPNEMKLLYSMNNYVVSSEETVTRDKLFPVDETSEGNHLYTFVPLFTPDYNLGYLVCGDCHKEIADTTLQQYQEQIISSLEKYIRSTT